MDRLTRWYLRVMSIEHAICDDPLSRRREEIFVSKQAKQKRAHIVIVNLLFQGLVYTVHGRFWQQFAFKVWLIANNELCRNDRLLFVVSWKPATLRSRDFAHSLRIGSNHYHLT